MLTSPAEAQRQRNYHPIPAIQLDEFSRKNITDAPRMKAQLKSCTLPHENGVPTEGLRAIAASAVRLPFGLLPLSLRSHMQSGRWSRTTDDARQPSVLALRRRLAHHRSLHAGRLQLCQDFLRYERVRCRLVYCCFALAPTRHSVRSSERADAVLCIVHHFLESKGVDAELALPPGEKVDLGIVLHRSSVALTNENVDTAEEVSWGADMAHYRRSFTAKTAADLQAAMSASERESIALVYDFKLYVLTPGCRSPSYGPKDV